VTVQAILSRAKKLVFREKIFDYPLQYYLKVECVPTKYPMIDT